MNSGRASAECSGRPEWSGEGWFVGSSIRRISERLIELTPGGASAAERYLQTVIGWFTDALADWSPQDQQTFGRLLGRFVGDVTIRLAASDVEGPPGTR